MGTLEHNLGHYAPIWGVKSDLHRHTMADMKLLDLSVYRLKRVGSTTYKIRIIVISRLSEQPAATWLATSKCRGTTSTTTVILDWAHKLRTGARRE